MASTYLQGIPRPVDLAGVVLDTDVSVARMWRPNRTPIFSRFNGVPVTSYHIKIWQRQYRPRTTTITVDPGTGGTTLTLATVGFLMNGDVLQLNSGEFVEIVDHPNTTAGTILVRRAVGGTTAAVQTVGSTVTLIGNSRTGAETQQKAITEIPGNADQYVQTFQHIYSVSGGQAVVRTRYSTGAAPYPEEKLFKMQNLKEDLEFSAMYGLPENVGGVVTRYKMCGMFNYLQTNNIVAPTNAGAYKPSDFYRDVFQRALNNGGAPDILLVSPGWLLGLAVWGFTLQRLDAGATVFGTAFEAFSVPFLPNVTIIPAPLMQGISALALQSDEVNWGVLEDLRAQDYGITGDAREGDWLCRRTILIENEPHHAAVRNITAFAKEA
jgi:hypothetical protein